MFLRNPYNYDTDLVSEQTALTCSDPSRTRQSDAIDADINTIVKRFKITGVAPTNVRVPTYQDFADVFDYQTAMNAIVEAERSFMQMDWEVRKRFDNDPQKFVEFCSDKENLAEMRKLGLAVPEPAKPENTPA